MGAPFDMLIRWNSTYYMIENLLKQRQYLQAFYNVHYPYNTIGHQGWVIIESLYNILGDLENATTILSGIYPTSHLLLNQLYILAIKIEQ